MKKLNLLIFCLFYWIASSGYNYPFEQLQLAGVENPVYVTVSPDGLKMIVVDLPKREPMQVKICSRPYTKSPWSVASSIPEFQRLMNKELRIEGFCFSCDMKRLYYAANLPGTLGGMDIFYSEVTDNGFSDPIHMGPVINSEADENYPSISGNNRAIYFTREVKMKKLEQFKTGELYKSEKNDQSNEWQEPEKINNQINNGGLAYARIYDDNRTIIYANIKDDKEGWKITWTKRLNDIHWYLPVTLDTLDSKDVEISPSYCKQDQLLYFVKLDNDGFNLKGEIYQYHLDQQFKPDKTVEFEGKAVNAFNGNPLSVNVLVTDPELGRVKYLTRTDENGDYWTLLNSKQPYIFHVWEEGYSHQYKLFGKDQTTTSHSVDFELFPKVDLTLNMYDKEELWPLDGILNVSTADGKAVMFESEQQFKGQKTIQLAIGTVYHIGVSAKDYFDNVLELDLSNIVLFNDLVRDIELVPEKRKLEIEVKDAMNKNPLNASIEVIDKYRRTFVPSVQPGSVGKYTITLREGEPFDVEVRGPRGFAFKHTRFDLDADRSLKLLQIELQPLMRKVPIRLNNINFEYNSSDLLETSFPELNRVVQLLKENPDIHVEIMAHTDDIGSERYNNVLADKRALSVVEYLIISGIHPDRLVPKGYGESMPLVPNTSEENRAINRRVEMKILDEDDEDFMLEERIIKD